MRKYVPVWKSSECSIIPEPPVCQVRKWPCCFDETNIHRNSAFLRGANLSCPAATCTMYRRPSNLLLTLGGHYEGWGEKKKSQWYRRNEMDSCIKWMRPSALQDLGYTTVDSTYGALCPTFPRLFHDRKPKLCQLKATFNLEPSYWNVYLSKWERDHYVPSS